MCRDIMHRAQNGNRIGGSAEADVPNDELAAMIFQSLADFELPNVKSLRFGLGTDDRMKRLSRMLAHGFPAPGGLRATPSGRVAPGFRK